MAEHVRSRRDALYGTQEGDSEDWWGGGAPPAPLSQTVADIVDLYKGCRSFVAVSGGIETQISNQTGVLFYNSNIMVKKNDIYCNPPILPSESCPSVQLTNIPIKCIPFNDIII